MKVDLQTLENATELAMQGNYSMAKQIYLTLLKSEISDKTRARIENDLSTIAAVQGHHFSSQLHSSRIKGSILDSSLTSHNQRLLNELDTNNGQQVKVAILSLLFNWPSTGGGTVHTKELAKFLQRDGYQVRHIYAVNESFGVGKVTQNLDYDSDPLYFTDAEWNDKLIRERFRIATNDFSPDWVIVTDSWNTKPLLAEAVFDYPYFLRIAAEECLCPLNNVRMLFKQGSSPNKRPEIIQCDQNQLESPHVCRECVIQNSQLSGGLHKAERLLGGFNVEEYSHRLRQSFEQAEGVLAVNPEIAQLIEPFTPAVHVVPSGFDLSRFPKEYIQPPASEGRKLRILFAGLRDELMKGFYVLHAATDQLWERRKDFELWITGEPRQGDPEYFRCIGWQSQQELTKSMCLTDLLVFPTVAQEALGRSAVEAMGCGRPVIASRIGGLNWVIEHEKTGLLSEPGNVDDLCQQLERLLDDPDLRENLGKTGQEKFYQKFTWEVVLDHSYRKLFGPSSKKEALQLDGAEA